MAVACSPRTVQGVHGRCQVAPKSADGWHQCGTSHGPNGRSHPSRQLDRTRNEVLDTGGIEGTDGVAPRAPRHGGAGADRAAGHALGHRVVPESRRAGSTMGTRGPRRTRHASGMHRRGHVGSTGRRAPSRPRAAILTGRGRGPFVDPDVLFQGNASTPGRPGHRRGSSRTRRDLG